MDNKLFLRGLILYHFDSGFSYHESYKLICKTYGNGCISKITVWRWYNKFKLGSSDLNDINRIGRPLKNTNEEILSVLNQDNSATLSVMADKLNIHPANLYKRLDKMGIVRKKSVIVPYKLDLDKRLNRVVFCEHLIQYNNYYNFLNTLLTCDEKWIFYCNDNGRKFYWLAKGTFPPTQSAQHIHMKKVLMTCWWDKKGIVFLDFLPNKTTVNYVKYKIYIRSMLYNLKFIRPEYFIEGKQLYLLDDNATPHRTPCVKELLEQLNIESIIHPSCSPDLAPSDFYLFRKLNNWLQGQAYSNNNELIEGVKSYLYGQDEAFYSKGIDELRNRWERVVQLNGNYITDS